MGSKMSEQMDSVLGSMKETVAKTFGARKAQRGREYAPGQSGLNAARTQGYAEGTVDRMVRKKDDVVATATGDRTQQTDGNVREEKGERQQAWDK